MGFWEDYFAAGCKNCIFSVDPNYGQSAEKRAVTKFYLITHYFLILPIVRRSYV